MNPAQTHSEERLRTFETDAMNYPNVGPDDFNRSYVIAIDRTAKTSRVTAVADQTVSVRQDGEVTLKDATELLPTYTITMLDEHGRQRSWSNRVAIAAIGSNSSPDVLHEKFVNKIKMNFNAAAAGRPLDAQLDIAVISAQLPGHAVVHGAFMGVYGSVPATIRAEQGTTTTVTVGFYDAAAAEQMTGTEANYDGVRLEQSAFLANGMEIRNPVAYVSPWGALRDPENPARPMALSAIPSTTPLRRVTTHEALLTTARLTEGHEWSLPENEADLRAFIRGGIVRYKGDDASLALRFDRILALQMRHRLAPNVRGQVIFPCTIRRDNERAAAILQLAETMEAPQIVAINAPSLKR